MNPHPYIVDHPNYAAWTAKMEELNWTVAGTNWLEEASGDGDYALWLYLCNRRMIRIVGLGIHSIEDWGWADAYESEVEPAEAVTDALANAGYEG